MESLNRVSPCWSLRLERVQHVELQPLQPWLRRLRASEMQGSADEVDERELHVAVELIENARAMLRYVAPLSQFAVIEVR